MMMLNRVFSLLFAGSCSYSTYWVIILDCIPSWWIWGFWISPLMYAQNAASVNEFLGHSWNKVRYRQSICSYFCHFTCSFKLTICYSMNNWDEIRYLNSI